MQKIDVKETCYFTLILIANYYFTEFHGKLSQPSITDKIISLIILSLFSFFFLYLIKYFSSRLNTFILLIILTWILVQLIKTYFQFLNLFSLTELIQNIKIFKLSWNNYEILKKIIVFVIPYICCFCLIFLSKKNKEIIRFIKINSLIFLIFIFYFEILNYNKEILNYNKTEQQKTFNKISKIKDRQVLWFILDAYDPIIASKILLKKNLKNTDGLKSKSFINSNFYTPSRYTISSVPSTMMGILIERKKIINNKLFFKELKKDNLIEFNYQNTFFNEIDNSKGTVAIYSSVLEYCTTYLGSKNFYECKDIKNNSNYYFKGVFFHFFPLKKIKYLIFLVKKINSESNEINYENVLLNKGNLSEKLALNDSIDGSFITFKKIDKCLKNKINLCVFHLWLPHPPAIQSEKFYNVKSKSHYQDYILNLYYTDIVIKKIIDLLKNYKNENMLILSSDHWYRSKDKNKKNIYPSLFLTKISNDNQKVINDNPTNSIYIGQLIKNFLEKKINYHEDVRKFFTNNQKTHTLTENK